MGKYLLFLLVLSLSVSNPDDQGQACETSVSQIQYNNKLVVVEAAEPRNKIPFLYNTIGNTRGYQQAVNERSDQKKPCSEFTIELRISDAKSSLEELKFGVRPTGQSVAAPPPPPEGALHAYFRLDGNDLFQDFRDNTDQNLTWNLHYSIGSGSEITIEWTEEGGTDLGAITIRDTGGNVLADMGKLSSFTFLPTKFPVLRIVFLMNDLQKNQNR